ncbi:ABC transporter ATP-binding protein [Sediminispirochaeta bajacaliforniensis]|uniref:ABC transporter ATP-binding protein n=1 Tax=Sediminispirochaeta bajacaliforniensis TaxID=148 RepID=UPI00036068C1|nr:ATP-binding cassette domain-containing protein [Sediminispirochaeta bajacaliforniensis]
MIHLESVTKIFNEGTVNETTAVRNLNLTVREGDFVTVIGSNGAGKSTLLNLIAGSYAPSSGTISVNGNEVTKVPEYRRARYIGRIFQNPLLGTAGNMSLEDNMMISYRKGFKGLKISLNQKMRELFRRELKALDMGLEDRLENNVSLLSGGQRQALTLLMMVISRPSLVLLDEHTAALDPRNAAKVLELTKRFITEYGLTAIMITHNMEYAIRYGTRLLMMDGGEIIFDIDGREKSSLTVDRLVAKFHELRNHDLASDRVLLS